MHVLCALAACVPAPSHSITLTFRRRRQNAAAPPMPLTPCRRRMYTIAVGRRRRFAFLSFAAAVVAGDNGRRLSAWALGGYVHVYTYVYYYSQRQTLQRRVRRGVFGAVSVTCAARRWRRVRRGVDGGAAGGKYISSSSRHLTCDTKGAHSCLLLLCFSSSLCHICPTVSRKAAHDVRSLPLCI